MAWLAFLTRTVIHQTTDDGSLDKDAQRTVPTVQGGKGKRFTYQTTHGRNTE